MYIHNLKVDEHGILHYHSSVSGRRKDVYGFSTFGAPVTNHDGEEMYDTVTIVPYPYPDEHDYPASLINGEGEE